MECRAAHKEASLTVEQQSSAVKHLPQRPTVGFSGGLSVWLPATGFGNTGAASGAVGLCVAVRGLQRNYAPAPVVAVLSASDGAERAALILSGNAP